MDNRLLTIYRMIKWGKGVLDVGTDHGYIPIALAENGYTGFIYASDIGQNPLDSAVRHAISRNVCDKIHFFLCDGISPETDTLIDTIVIAGMGGEVICGIMDRAEWCWKAGIEFIFQPMSKPEILRYWLINNGFVIIEERLCRENRLYSVFKAEFRNVNTNYTLADLYIGKKNNHILCPEYLALLKQESDKIHRILTNLPASDKFNISYYCKLYNDLDLLIIELNNSEHILKE